MAIKEREALREIIDSIEVSDFTFKVAKLNGKIEQEKIKVIEYIDTNGTRMHEVSLRRVTVSEVSWYGRFDRETLFYDEFDDEVTAYYYSLSYYRYMNDEKYNDFKALIENVKYIETIGNIMYATFSNNEKLNSIKELKLFTSLLDRFHWGLKGCTGENFVSCQMEAPIFMERNKILNLIDYLSDYTEADKEKLVRAYKAFLHKKLKELEEERA